MVKCSKKAIKMWFDQIENTLLNKDITNIIRKYVGNFDIAMINHSQNEHTPQIPHDKYPKN